MLAPDEPRCRLEVVVGPERHDEDVCLMHARVGGHPEPVGVDSRHRLAQEPHAGLREARVRKTNLLERLPPEHHVELRVSEDEGVVPVDQGDPCAVAERLGEEGRELETAEARPQDDDARVHRTSLSPGPTRRGLRTYRSTLPSASLRYWCTKAMAMLPSPTAAATRLTGAKRTSPHAKMPGTLVSSR